MNKSPVLSRLFGYLSPYKKLLALAFGGAALGTVFSLLGPVFIGKAVDSILAPGKVDFGSVLGNLLWLAGSAGGAGLFLWAAQSSVAKIAHFATRDLRKQAFENINRQPLKRIDTHPHGDLASRLVNDADAVYEGFNQGIGQLIPGAVTILATLVLMFLLNWIIALVVVVVTPVSILFARFIAKQTSSMFRRQQTSQGAISAYVNEMVQNQELVSSFGFEKNSAETFAKLCDDYYDSGFKATFYSSISNPGTRFVNSIVYAAVGIIGSLIAIFSGAITVGGISAFLSYANQYTKPFNEVTAVLTQLQNAFASAGRIFEVIDWPAEEADVPLASCPASSEGLVSAQNVYFSYQPERPLIQDFSLLATPGSRIALVGPTGCGKTTLINLLMRFYEVEKGEIAVDGTPVRAIQRNALRGLYGMVLQETWLKSATVAENIAYAKPQASCQEIEEAAKAAYAHNFILRLPNGYNTMLGASGSGLSAGQRQLLCIARIMLAKPDMLILDEATSSIDTRTEMLIGKALDNLMQGHTSFIVAHRLSTIQNADCILVMDKGRIVERGTHTQLLAAGGFYARLYHSQFTAN